MKKASSKVRRVLIVEDDSWLANNHITIMKVSGYEASAVSSSEAAIAQIDDKAPDVIVLDVMLEGGTAFALMHELQSYEDTARIPVILCSNIPGELLDHEALERYGVRIVLDRSDRVAPDGLRRSGPDFERTHADREDECHRERRTKGKK
jgi:PleD family two-component response regulator